MTRDTENDENRPISIGAFKAFVTQYKAAQDSSYSYQQKNHRWSVYTAIAVSIYTAITAAIFVVAYFTFQNEKTNSYYSQRASVILTDLLPIAIQINNVIIGYVVIPQWTNVGNTDASNMNYHNDYQFSRDDLAGGFTVFNGSTKVEGPASLGPKQILNAGAFRTAAGEPVYFPHSCFFDIAQGKLRYAHIWGWATYKDILRPEESRVTRYCWRIFGTLNVKGGLQFNHYLCDEGNCQDAACDIYKRMSAPKMPLSELCQPIAIPPLATVTPLQPAPVPKPEEPGPPSK